MADRQRGRFRAFLLTALKNFLANERRRGAALKRGGSQPPLSLDFQDGEQRYAREPSHDATPERIIRSVGPSMPGSIKRSSLTRG
jgi:RNA polymerase sigma-70 factor (ECF subfamily)